VEYAWTVRLVSLRGTGPSGGVGDFIPVTDEDVEPICRLPGLKALFCSGITDVTLERLAGLAQLNDLTLETSPITDNGLLHISGFRNLETFCVAQCQGITDRGFEYLSQLENLQLLALPRCPRVTDAGLKHLAKLTKLRWLNLAGTGIKGPGLEHLRNSSLAVLYLNGTDVDDEAMAHVAAMTSLVDLELDETLVTDRGIARLRALKGLNRISLMCVNFTEASFEVFESIPAMTSVWGHSERISRESAQAIGTKHLNWNITSAEESKVDRSFKRR
jgi:hypothetical protein